MAEWPPIGALHERARLAADLSVGPSVGPRLAIVVAAIAVVVAACNVADETGTPVVRPSPTVSMSATGTPAAGSMGPTDVSAGAWDVLFDGTPTSSLRGYGRDEFPDDRWVIDGDALRTVPGPGVDLVTRDTYEDFELEFEWRVSPGGNSGVMYRVAETADPAWATGPEYQILDDAVHPDGGDPATSAAALYDLLAPGPDKRLEPVGRFNKGRIVVRDGHVEHWLNGSLVVEYDWGGAAIRDRIAASKFAALNGFMRRDAGHVAFQHHGEEAWLRAIRIRRLDE